MKVLYFMARWCAPCKAFLPVVEVACEEKGVPLELLNVEDEIAVVHRRQVKSVPTLIILDDSGVEIFRTASVMPAASLRQTLEGLR